MAMVELSIMVERIHSMISFRYDAEAVSGEKVRSILVVHSYPNDLYLSWVIEYLNEIINRNRGINIKVIDVATHAWHRESNWKSEIKKYLMSTKNNSTEIFKYFNKKKQIEFITIKKDWISPIIKLMKIMRKVNNIPNVNSLLNSDIFTREQARSIHSSLANKFWTIYYEPKKHKLRTAIRALSYELVYEAVTNEMLRNKYDQVVVCNGRLPNSAGAAQASKDMNVEVRFLERGGTPGMLNIFQISPHSMAERYLNCLQLWEDYSKDHKVLGETISKSYIKLRSGFDPIAGKSWTKQMIDENGEKKHLIKERKYLCVFYTSTELEFAVYGDVTKPQEFKNQREALNWLLDFLSDDWQIVVRRHPHKINRFFQRKDPEAQLWHGLDKDPRVIIVKPDSSLNSYELAMEANLVCHFNSSIGAEIALLNSVPVLSLGQTYWDDRVEIEKLKLKDFELNMSENNRSKQLERALRWGLYSAIAGRPFKIIKWRNQRGYMFDCGLYSKKLKGKLVKEEI